MRLVITEDGAGAAQWVAALVKRRITEFAPTAERPFVLGLPTGSSPIATYKVCPTSAPPPPALPLSFFLPLFHSFV
jgi:6-phosphogluconolactonase/glucosamine-6-phosphate isomerase/deaminase